MKYLFSDGAGEAQLKLRGDAFHYIKKVRRARIGDTLHLRDELQTQTCYTYKIEAIEGKSVHLSLQSFDESPVLLPRALTLGWCIIDTNSIEKVLPMLNEIGVARIVFIACERSQRNIKLDFDRFRRIVKASMQQCGRTAWMEFEQLPSLEAFLQTAPTCTVLDFAAEPLRADSNTTHVLIGCEGGFTAQERLLFATHHVVSLPSHSVLRSESAAVVAASLQLLG